MAHDSLEKSQDVLHAEQPTSDDSIDARIEEFTLAEQKRIVQRIDRRLVPTLAILYCCSLVDRNNLGSAAIAG